MSTPAGFIVRFVAILVLVTRLVPAETVEMHASPAPLLVPDGDLDAAVDRIGDETARLVEALRGFDGTAPPEPEHRRILEAILTGRPTELDEAARGVRLEVRYAIEIHLARFAHGILRELLASEHPPSAHDLLALATESYLESRREFDGPVQREFGEFVDASLAKPLAARWLLFAALREDRVFETAGAPTREEFISRLLFAGESSAALAYFVRGALAPPFAVRWRESGLAFPAGPFRKSRGRVGFTADHAAIVRSLEESRSFEASLRPVPPVLDPTVPPRQDDRAFLDDYVATLREWILDELDPSRSQAPIGSPNLLASDVEREWRDLASQLGPEGFWAIAKPYFLALLAGETVHVHDARIAELEARGADLGEREEHELAALRSEREADRRRLLTLLPELYAERAPIVDAFTNLLECDTALLGFGDPALRDAVLAPAFAAVSYRDGSFAAARLGEHLEAGTNTSLPPAARAAMIRAITLLSETTSGSIEVLARCAREGDDFDRVHALTAIHLQPASIAEDLVRRATQDCRALASRSTDPGLLRLGVLSSILDLTRRAQTDEERARAAELFLETFEGGGVNLWESGIPLVADRPEARADLRILANSIPAAAWARLELAGRIPENLKAQRD